MQTLFSPSLMQSPNKKPPTAAERRHIARVKDMACAVCDAPGPSECHEPKQGEWWLSIPLCPACHRGAYSGLHGQKRAWLIRKMDEWSALAITIRRLMT